MGWRTYLACAIACAAPAVLPQAAAATNLSGAMVSSSDCTTHSLERNDDSSTSVVPLPFEINFYGQRFNETWVNNNGNVTFDGPLSTYTPFGLQAAGRSIIAPFFADVDTRAAGSEIVKYGWGNTTFEGRRALCVNYENVGYYGAHDDKLNSFQLLLVDRAGGDFDIVFNYGSITWETGDASGGVGGLGGDSARVGFANGDGSAINSFELPGSGMDGRLLDSSANGLIHDSLRSSQRGRYVFPVRNGQTVDKYVALGDSYNSGLGAYDYEPGTDIEGVNQCQRSFKAYAHLLVDRGDTPWDLDFAACAGATIPTLYSDTLSTESAPFNEDKQIEHVKPDAALVTLGIGGNDLDFAGILANCLSPFGEALIGSCEDESDDDVFDRLMGLMDHSGPDGLNRFQQIYDDIRTRAPRAQLVTTGYPKFFPDDGAEDLSNLIDGFPGIIAGPIGGIIGATTGDGRCQGVRLSDQLWMNQKVAQLDRAIAASSRSMGADYVPTYDASDGRELCSDNDPLFLHGYKPKADVPPAERESFHPTAYGHEVMADRIAGRLDPPPPPPEPVVTRDESGTTTSQSHTIEQDELLDLAFDIGQMVGLAFNTFWPGSDIEMTLVSPSGKLYTRQTLETGLFHRNGPTSETYVIRNPEPGTWRVRLRGAEVDPGGELTQLQVFEEAIPNELPTAKITQTQTDTRTVTLSAAGSTDADGEIKQYLWELGDGTAALGREVTHKYAEDGNYRVTLVVQDDDKGLGFATADADVKVVVPKYAFSGFFAPVDNRPTINAAKAGSAIPVKFSLGKDEGLEIFEEGYPKSQRIDCDSGAVSDEIESTVTPGESTLTYDATSGRYQYVWKTQAAWSGTCRRLIVGLDDGSRHEADFRFR